MNIGHVLCGITYMWGESKLMYLECCWRKLYFINLMYNISLRISSAFAFKKLEMFTFVEMYIFDLSKEQ